MIQALIKDRGGTVETYFLRRQAASCTYALYDGNGSQKATGTATVDPVATTLSVAATAGDTVVHLTSTVGLTPGYRYLLGSSPQQESVGVKQVTTTGVELWAPLGYDHAVAEAVVGTRVSFDVSSSVAAQHWWDGYAVFTPDTGDENTETVDCVRRKIPEALIDETDIRLIIPKAAKALSAELDMPLAFREARDQLLIDLGGKNRALTMLGVDHFRRPAAIKFWLLRRLEFGDEWATQMDVLQREYDALVQHIIGQTPVDADQDGKTNGPGDRGYTVITLERA